MNTARPYALRLLVAVLVIAMPVPGAFAGNPDIQRFTTSNGAEVYFVAAPEIPILDVRAVFAAGSARDGGSPGLANLTNGLLREGAGELDADAFSEQLGATGARLEIGAARDMAYASLRTLAEARYADPALALLADALARPRFDADALERLKARVLVSLRHQQQSPARIAENAFYAALYPAHPYGSPPDGTETSVAALSRADVAAFHERYYVAKNLVIAIVGAVGLERARDIAERVSGGLPAGTAAAALPEIALPGGTRQDIAFPSIQSHVRVGLPGMRRGDPDYFPLLVGNHALGGNSLVSILFREIRSKRGLSYSAYSYFLPMSRPGPFVAALQTDRSQQREALEVLHETLASFVADGPPADDLDAAKQNLIGGFPLRIDSNEKIVEYIAMIGFYRLPLDYLETFSKRVAEVTPEQVRDAFRRRVDVSKLVTVVVGRPEETPAES